MAMDNIFGISSAMTSAQAAKEAMDRLTNKIKAEEAKQKLLDKQKEAQVEWIWVEGYKATNSDMKCNGYQYEFGKVHYMPTDAKIVECESGFHLCRDLKDVFGYYKVKDGHRFFKVKALVRKKDYEEYGCEVMQKIWALTIPAPRTKLVSSAIEFISELSADEVLDACMVNTNGWTEEDKKIAMSQGIEAAQDNVKVRELTSLGYTLPFAQYLVDNGFYDRAVAIGSQSDLSMDVKVMFIMRGK